MSDNNISRYWANSNYLVSLSKLINNIYSSENDLLVTLKKCKEYKKLQINTEVDIVEISKLLRQSWFIEIAIQQKSAQINLFPYELPWCMVQCYYSMYSMVRAFFLSMNVIPTSSHSQNLRCIADFVKNKNGLFPIPWGSYLEYDANMKSLLYKNFLNPPSSLKNALVSPDNTNPWEFFGLFLRTTRNREVESRINKWKFIKKRKRISRADREKYENKVICTTLYDAIYRMRIRANYKDIDPFAFSLVGNFGYITLIESLNRILNYSNFLLESMIYKSIGKAKFELISNEFSTHPNLKNCCLLLKKRWLCY